MHGAHEYPAENIYSTLTTRLNYYIAKTLSKQAIITTDREFYKFYAGMSHGLGDQAMPVKTDKPKPRTSIYIDFLKPAACVVQPTAAVVDLNANEEDVDVSAVPPSATWSYSEAVSIPQLQAS